MQRITEGLKLDIGLKPTSLASTNATGDYYAMKAYHRVVGVLTAAAMAVTKTAKIELFEATDAAGTSAALIANATATITANVNVAELTVALATVLAGETVVINGLTFLAHTDTTTVADREFSISGNDTADAAALATLINDATYGVPGVSAVNSTGTLTLTADDPGATTISASSGDSTFTIATIKAVAYVELDNFDLSSGFSHVACKVTTDATIVVAADLARGDPRGPVAQQVAASAAI